MAMTELFNAAVAGIIIGWWLRDIGRAARSLLERAAPAPRPAGVDDGAAEPIAGDSPARAPGAEPTPQPAGGHDDGDCGGDSPKNLQKAHANSVSQKQEAGK